LNVKHGKKDGITATTKAYILFQYVSIVSMSAVVVHMEMNT